MVQQYQYYYEDWDNVSEPLDAGEIEHRESDSSDFEDTYIKKKRRKKQAGGRVSNVRRCSVWCVSNVRSCVSGGPR